FTMPVGEPRPAMSPPASGDQFTVVVEGIAPYAISKYWRGLCQFNGTPPSPEFKEVYANVSTVRGNRFRFRGGNRERIRASLEQIFRDVAPAATTRLLKVEQETSVPELATV